jgi:hypothetical protein
MAFGRDGSELELSIYDLQNRILRDALNEIFHQCNDKEIKKIAKNAIHQAENVIKNFDI